MKTTYSFNGFAKSSILASCLLPGLFLAQTSFAATCIWTGAAGDSDWDNADNWSTLLVPVAGDKVYITNNATFSVNINDDATFSRLTVGGTSGTITLNWQDGWITGKVTLGQNAVLNLVNDSSYHLLSGVITNYGRINWQQGGWGFNNGSRLENESGALVNVQCDETIGCDGVNNNVINNAGTFRKSAGAGETDVSPTPAVALNNTGTIDVESGTLNLYGSGTNNGTINVAGGAIFAMSGGTYWFGPNTLFTGTGVCEMGQCSVFGKLSGATMTYSIVYDVTFNTELASGTMICDANQYGPLTIDSNAVYNIGSGDVYGAMTNWGRIVYPAGSPENSWRFNAPARLENRPGGVIDLQADLRFYYGGGVVHFNNAGTLLKSGGTNESIIDPGFRFNNTGTINVQSGTLALNGMTSSSAINIGAGAVVSLDSGNFYFGPTNIFTGTGVLDLNGWPPCGITGPLKGSADFQMTSDANFTNCVLGGTLFWISGDMDGVLTVGTNGAVEMTNSETMFGSITNLGMIALTPPGLDPGAVGTFCSLSVGDNYWQGSSGTFGLSVGGQVTDQYDQLLVGGTASLNGELLVDLVNGFQPANGNSFKFLSCTSLKGTFSSLALPAGMSVAYTTNAAKLITTTAVGALKVTLQPVAVTNGARWQVDGGSWRTSGTTVTNLLIGTHTVGFNLVADWTSPANLSVIISQSKTTSTNASYLPLTNQLQIQTVGLGKVSPNYSNAWLQIGSHYSITSSPASGFVFDGWTISTNWIGGVTNYSRALQFTMASNLTLLATFFETSRPSFTITAPTAGQRWSNTVFTASGTATDRWQVANVRYQLNHGNWHHATGSNHWTATLLDLIPGTNLFTAYAVNITGWHSFVTNSVSFDYVVTNRLEIETVGLGKVSPNYSNAWLEIGRNYSITSSPASGFVFTNWTVSTNWVGGLTTTNKALRFMMASNLTLLATFVETSRPTLTISSPTNRQHFSNNQAALKGTASDKWAVTNVAYSLNGVWSNATTSNNWSNWNAILMLVSGTNYISAYAQNQGGNYSTTNSIYVVSTFTGNIRMNVAVPPKQDGGFTFTLQLLGNASGHLEYSSDLIHWTSWTNFDATNGSIQFHDASATNAPMRFYRAVVP